MDVDPRNYSRRVFSSPFLTACFQIDTYHHRRKRSRSSVLYDLVFVFHPGFEDAFQSAGCPSVTVLPHAVRGAIFRRFKPHAERRYEVGWVGRTDLKFYSFRRRCLHLLAANFTMNAVDRVYPEEEMADLYGNSKIVVNLGRDDYLKDANLRCFEAMAAGALLVCPMPTELTSLGFVAGQHFVGIEGTSDLIAVVRKYLADNEGREQIAHAAREIVLSLHTYDARATTLIDTVAKSTARRGAPYRQWTVPRQHAALARYYADYQMIDASMDELGMLRIHSRASALLLTPSIGLSCCKKLFRRL